MAVTFASIVGKGRGIRENQSNKSHEQWRRFCSLSPPFFFKAFRRIGNKFLSFYGKGRKEGG